MLGESRHSRTVLENQNQYYVNRVLLIRTVWKQGTISRKSTQLAEIPYPSNEEALQVGA